MAGGHMIRLHAREGHGINQTESERETEKYWNFSARDRIIFGIN